MSIRLLRGWILGSPPGAHSGERPSAPPGTSSITSSIRSWVPRPVPHPGAAPRLIAGLLLVGVTALGLPGRTAAQSSTYVTTGRLESVFPGADRFSRKSGDPPVYRAYRVDPDTGEETLLGFAFLTEDLPPEREGYSAPIRTLVGMDLEGVLTGIRVMSYRESLRGSRGDFLGRPGVQGQFRGKSVRDPFRVRQDVRNVTGATITTRALALGVRNAARRVAAAYLLNREGEGPAPRIGTIPMEEIEPLLWAEMVGLGLVLQVSGEVGREEPLSVSTAYLRDRAMVEAFFGPSRIDELLADVREDDPEGHLFFLGLNGPDVIIFSARRISFVQDGDTIHAERSDFTSAGRRTLGKAGGQFDRAGILVVDPALDVRRPFTFRVDLERDRGFAEGEYRAFGEEAEGGEGAAGGELDVVAAEAGTPGEAAPEGRVAEEGAVDGNAPDGERVDRDAVDRNAVDEDVADPSLTAGDGDAEVAGGGGVGARDFAAAGTASARGGNAGAAGSVRDPGFELTDDDLAGLLVEDAEEGSLLAETLAQTYWPRVISLFLLLALVTWAFIAKTKPVARWLALAGTVGFLGFVDGGFLSVSHIVAGISVGPEVFLGDLSLLILASFTVVTTLMWGRVFCGYLCPFGALQDILDRIVPDRFRRELPRAVHERALWLKYGILVLILAPAVLGLPVTVYYWFEPFGTVFFWSSSAILWAIALAILAASAIVPRFYCRYACPLGAALAVGSLASPFRIRRVEQCTICTVCERKCPTGAIAREKIDFKECVRCNECEIQLLHRTGVCQHDMDAIRPRLVQMRTPSSRGG